MRQEATGRRNRWFNKDLYSYPDHRITFRYPSDEEVMDGACGFFHLLIFLVDTFLEILDRCGTDMLSRNFGIYNYQSLLRNTPEERRFHWHRGGSLKLRLPRDLSTKILQPMLPFLSRFVCHFQSIWTLRSFLSKMYLTFRRLMSTIVDVPHR